MNLPDRNIATWIVYSAIYVCGFVVLLSLAAFGLEEWDSKKFIPVLANVTNGAIGIGLFAALTWEVIRFSMVIFYPILKRRLMEEGRREGRQEGRQEERELWDVEQRGHRHRFIRCTNVGGDTV